MPLDSLGFNPTQNDWLFYKRANWYYKFSWLPHRCEISKKIIWFKRAYRGIAMYTGPGDPIFEYKWITRELFMLARLRGTL